MALLSVVVPISSCAFTLKLLMKANSPEQIFILDHSPVYAGRWISDPSGRCKSVQGCFLLWWKCSSPLNHGALFESICVSWTLTICYILIKGDAPTLLPKKQYDHFIFAIQLFRVNQIKTSRRINHYQLLRAGILGVANGREAEIR